jgi:hypothetical protein
MPSPHKKDCGCSAKQRRQRQCPELADVKPPKQGPPGNTRHTYQVGEAVWLRQGSNTVKPAVVLDVFESSVIVRVSTGLLYASFVTIPSLLLPRTTAASTPEKKLAAVEDLIAIARSVSPGERMVVYLVDLERALGLTDREPPHKVGGNG